MARKKLTIRPGSEFRRTNCFAFYIDKSGNPDCHALRDVYCLKEKTPCKFRATPESAAAARKKALQRLAAKAESEKQGAQGIHIAK